MCNFDRKLPLQAFLDIYPTLAHTEEIVALYAEAVDEVFKEIATVIHGGNIQQALKGPVALPTASNGFSPEGRIRFLIFC